MPAQQSAVANHMNLNSALEMAPTGEKFQVNGKEQGRVLKTFYISQQNGENTVSIPCRVVELDGNIQNIQTFCRDPEYPNWRSAAVDYLNQTSNQPRVVGRSQHPVPHQSQQPIHRTPLYGRVGEESSRIQGKAQDILVDHAKCKIRGGDCDLTGRILDETRYKVDSTKDTVYDTVYDTFDRIIDQCVRNPSSCFKIRR